MGQWSLNWLGRRPVFLVLLGLNVLVTLAIMWASRHTMLSDAWSYICLAEGITHGEYSMWWQLPEEYPDTFRAPGYPLFLAFFIAVFGTWKVAVPVQFAMYAWSVWAMLKVVERLDDRLATRSLFLLLLLPMVNVPYYITQIYTEVPTLTLVTGVLYLLMVVGLRRWYHAALLGALFALLFQMKPVFLLFPFVFVAIFFYFDRSRTALARSGLVLAVFVGLLLPYALWNKKHHGVLKPTPLEGSGYYMHFAHWAGKFPGYTEQVYWYNSAGNEIVRFVDDTEIQANISAYEGEWAEFKTRLAPLLTARDSAMFDARPNMPHGTVNTFNTAYTLERERLLAEKAMEHLRAEPGYTALRMAYTGLRVWVIGVQLDDLRSTGALGKAKLLFPAVVTGLTFILLVVFVPLAYRKSRLDIRRTWPLLLFLIYISGIYLPFTIQARYSTPVRFAMFAILALAIAGLWWERPTASELNDANRG